MVEVGPISANIKTPERAISVTEGVPDEIEGRGMAGTSACQYGHLLPSISPENIELLALWSKVETTPLLDAVCFINDEGSQAASEVGILPKPLEAGREHHFQGHVDQLGSCSYLYP